MALGQNYLGSTYLGGQTQNLTPAPPGYSLGQALFFGDETLYLGQYAYTKPVVIEQTQAIKPIKLKSSSIKIVLLQSELRKKLVSKRNPAVSINITKTRKVLSKTTKTVANNSFRVIKQKTTNIKLTLINTTKVLKQKNTNIKANTILGNPFSGRNPVYNTYDTTISGLAPVAWWKLNDPNGSQTVQDYSGNNYTGTVASGVSLGQNPLMANNTSALFPGSSYISTTANPSGLNNFTFACWVNLQGNTQSYGRLFSNDYTQGDNKGVDISISPTGQFITVLGNGSSYVISATQTLVPINGPHFVVSTLNGSSLHHYVDGQLDYYSNTFTGTIASGVYGFMIGACPSGPSSYFNGDISEVAIFNYALSQSQISNLYTLGSSWTANYIRNKNIRTTIIQAIKSNKAKNTVLKSLQISSTFIKKAVSKSARTAYIQKAGEIGETLYRIIAVAAIWSVKQSKLASKNTKTALIQAIKTSKTKTTNIRSTQISPAKFSRIAPAIITAVNVFIGRLNKAKTTNIKIIKIQDINIKKLKSTTLRLTQVLSTKIKKTKLSNLKSVQIQTTKTNKIKKTILKTVNILTFRTKKNKQTTIKPTQILTVTVTRGTHRRRGVTSNITYTIANTRRKTLYRQTKAVVINTLHLNKKIAKKVKPSQTNTSLFDGTTKWEFLVQFVTKIVSFNRQTIKRPNYGRPDPDNWDPNMVDNSTPGVEGLVDNGLDEDNFND